MDFAASAIIEKCGLFARLDQSFRDDLADTAVIREFAAGQRIFDQGDPPPGLFVMSNGLVSVFKLAPSGKQHILHLAEPGDTFAEVAVIGRFTCPAFAEAVEDSQCLMLETAKFEAMLDNDPRFARQLLISMSFWVRRFVNLMEDLVLRDAAGRVARYLSELEADNDNAVSLPTQKRRLASHLNLTSETLSRTLRRLGEQGLIEEGAETGRYVITDREGLRSASDGLFPKL